jgi:NTP pyrophosphatase (non-canonical NTP hydrolase)
MKYDKVYNKTIEELMELATVLMQQENKQQTKNYTSEIENEIGDVYFWLEELAKRFDQNKIQDRMDYKRKSYAGKIC